MTYYKPYVLFHKNTERELTSRLLTDKTKKPLKIRLSFLAECFIKNQKTTDLFKGYRMRPVA